MSFGYLSPEERENILGNVCGAQEVDIVQSETEVHDIIDARIDSNQNDQAYSIAELRTMSWMHFVQSDLETADDDTTIDDNNEVRSAEKVPTVVLKVGPEVALKY